MDNFYLEKSFHAWKKSGKLTLSPLKNTLMPLCRRILKGTLEAYICVYWSINIQYIQSGSDLWDCNIGLYHISVPINQLFITKSSL